MVAEHDIRISVSEAAELLGCSGQTIRNYCKSGSVRFEMNAVTGRWRIFLSDVVKLMGESKNNTPYAEEKE